MSERDEANEAAERLNDVRNHYYLDDSGLCDTCWDRVSRKSDVSKLQGDAITVARAWLAQSLALRLERERREKLERALNVVTIDEQSLHGCSIQWREDDGRHYVIRDGKNIWSGPPTFNAFEAARLSEDLRLERERREKAEAAVVDLLNRVEQIANYVPPKEKCDPAIHDAPYILIAQYAKMRASQTLSVYFHLRAALASLADGTGGGGK
jgi:hypothetical protein